VVLTGRPRRRIGVGSRLSTVEGGTGSPANGAVRSWLEFGLCFTRFRTSATLESYRGLWSRGIGHRAERPVERNYSSRRCTGKRRSGCCRKLGAPKISAKRSWGRGNAHRGWDWPEARRRAVVDDGGGGPTSPAAMSGQIRRRGSGSGVLEVCGGLGWPEGSCR
jgi:hypothetical protein